ncbi:hypothetical protein VCHA37P200_40288 [Vibrio chagasii]|nr:hypothetical protein VCHA55O507_40289 [Vibrio chagasii]CAH7420109.1 hypothetical protein VCHA37P200_40288 [Vibrio chagasii]
MGIRLKRFVIAHLVTFISMERKHRLWNVVTVIEIDYPNSTFSFL